MDLDASILDGTKNLLNVPPGFKDFDHQIITHINTVFSNLTQLGVGPPDGFMIEDDEAVWSDFIDDDLMKRFVSIKSYFYLKVRMLFDPPTTSFAIEAMEREIERLEWRLNVERESTDWVPGVVVEVVE